jgi:hypothetical protein
MAERQANGPAKQDGEFKLPENFGEAQPARVATKQLIKPYLKKIKYPFLLVDFVPPNLTTMLHQISSTLKINYHPFGILDYNHDIVISNDILSYSTEMSKAILRQSIFLSNNLTFNGYLKVTQRQTYKYYFKNNLIMSWNFELGNADYTCDIFIDDSRSIMLEIQDGKLKSCKLMIKGGNHGVEKRILMEKFFKNTWMVTGDRWREHMRKFIGQFFKECKF